MAKKKAAAPEGWPKGTGAVARELGVTEARVQVVLRCDAELAAAVPIVAGRRAWTPDLATRLKARLDELGARRPRYRRGTP